ncbi:MAG: hypothetical protein HOV79_22195 [Hamadaea sp.]|nr:hypothetical protein [Hamadaea sp.]
MLLNNMQYATNSTLSIDSGVRHLYIPMLPEHLRPVVVALLSGATDVAASHRLNCSPRTFSRRVSELLELLDAETRFQAGVKLAFESVREQPPTTVRGLDSRAHLLMAAVPMGTVILHPDSRGTIGSQHSLQ